MDTIKEEALRKLLYEVTRNQKPMLSQKSVFVVSGAPGSGKTTFVQKHKNEDDLVVDMDWICAALNGTGNLYQNHTPVLEEAVQVRDLLYQAIASRNGKWKNAWIVTAEARAKEVKRLAEQLGATVIEMPTTLDECINRLQKDARRKGSAETFISLAREWYAQQSENDG